MSASSHNPLDGGAGPDLPIERTFRFILLLCGSHPSQTPSSSPVRAGDEDAWRELVARFSRYVFAICSQAFRLRSEDCEEVFQEVFARTYEHLEKLRDDDAIRPWIGQLTRRLCIDHLRSSSREEIVDPEALPGGVDDAMETIDEAFAVHEAMAELTENCREILDRFFARDESYQTIGAALEILLGRSPAASPAARPVEGDLRGEETRPLARRVDGDRMSTTTNIASPS